MALQEYFTHFEQSQSLGAAKKGDPKENHLTCDLQEELGLIQAGLDPQQ